MENRMHFETLRSRIAEIQGDYEEPLIYHKDETLEEKERWENLRQEYKDEDEKARELMPLGEYTQFRVNLWVDFMKKQEDPKSTWNKCIDCGKYTLDYFYSSRRVCEDCQKIKRLFRRFQNHHMRWWVKDGLTFRRCKVLNELRKTRRSCKGCDMPLKISEYPRSGLCKSCVKDKNKVAKMLRNLMTDEELRDQTCEACGATRGLERHHIHGTETIDKILCHNCNTALGQYNDDPREMLMAALHMYYGNVNEEVVRLLGFS